MGIADSKKQDATIFAPATNGRAGDEQNEGVFIQAFSNGWRRFVFLSIDIILLTGIYLILNFIKRGSFRLNPMYIKMYMVLITVLCGVSFIVAKYEILATANEIKRGLGVIIKSSLFTAYCVSLLIVIGGLPAFSRLHIFGTCALLSIFEITAYSAYGWISKAPWTSAEKEDSITPGGKTSLLLMIADFFLLLISFWVINYTKRQTLNLHPQYEILLLITCGLWFVASTLTFKFRKQIYEDYYIAVIQCVKSFLLCITTVSLIIFAFRLFHYSRLHVYGTFGLQLTGEAILYLLYYLYYQNDLNGNGKFATEFVKKPIAIERKDLEHCDQEPLCTEKDCVSEVLSVHYLKNFQSLLSFIVKTIDLNRIRKDETGIVDTSNIYNVSVMDEESMRLFINLQRINDIRHINRYFLTVHRKLKTGGYFVGCVTTIQTYNQKFFKKYPIAVARVLFPVVFFLHRVFPKLPKLKRIYFALTGGRNRMISKAEALGRLYFCGFKVICDDEFDNLLFFIARKAYEPITNQIPSYGPFVSFKRVGANNQLIDIYKFRTMHPYSEFLQEYVYENNKLEDCGKFKEDFRITFYGRFMRKWWIDELPMMYNWIRGELQLVGVRPLTRHYLSLYDNELKTLRGDVRPGLIPPYYADLPDGLDEIMDSEKRYLYKYKASPIKTQIIYFLKVAFNILFRNARSS